MEGRSSAQACINGWREGACAFKCTLFLYEDHIRISSFSGHGISFGQASGLKTWNFQVARQFDVVLDIASRQVRPGPFFRKRACREGHWREGPRKGERACKQWKKAGWFVYRVVSTAGLIRYSSLSGRAGCYCGRNKLGLAVQA